MTRLLLLLCLVAAFDTAAADFKPDRPLAEQISVERGEFSADTSYTGPSLRGSTGMAHEALLVSVFVNRNNSSARVRWVLSLQAQYPLRWRFYKSVSLVGGAVIPAVVVGRHALSCSGGYCEFAEFLSFPLDDELVAASAATGLRARFNAEWGSFTIEVPAAYFAALQQALRQ